MNRLLMSVLVLTVLPAMGRAEPESPLKKTESQARAAANDAQRRAQRLLKLRQDLRGVSQELGRGLDGDMSLSALSKEGLARLRAIRKGGKPGPVLDAALRRLEVFYKELPKKEYAGAYGAGLVAAVAQEVALAADQANDEEDLLSLLESRLSVPNEVPTEDHPVTALEQFPEDLTVEAFKALGTVKTFMVKHRLNRPKDYAPTTAADLESGKHHVQVGVEVSGTVGYVDKAFDKDYCFNIGNVHMEMTPDWLLFHPGTKKPKVGDKIRVRGWTYYDVFHKAESEWDPKNPVVGDGRVTLWEIHPVQDVEIIH